jgi:hypothetical protein
MAGKKKSKLKKFEDVAKKVVSTAKKVEKISAKVAKIGMAGQSVLAGPTPSNVFKLGKTIFGNGDYRVKGNTIISNSIIGDKGMAVPSFKGDSQHLRVMHREYVGEVVSGPTTGLFNNTNYVINPGNVQTFPWLSKLAQNFDQWKPHGIVFTYVCTSSVFNAVNQSLGTVILATDYDVSDPPYASKVEMNNSEFAVSSAPDCNIIHPVECKPSEMTFNHYFVRDKLSLPSTDNAKFYDLGNFQVATIGVAGTNVTLGELWVTYDIEFTKEQYRPDTGILFSRNYATANFGTYFYSATPTSDNASTFVPTFTSAAIIFPNYLSNQHFMVIVNWTGASTSVSAPTITYTSNCTAGSAFNGAGTSCFVTSGVTTTFCSLQFTVLLTGPGAVITLGSGTLPATPTRTEVMILQRPQT